MSRDTCNWCGALLGFPKEEETGWCRDCLWDFGIRLCRRCGGEIPKGDPYRGLCAECASPGIQKARRFMSLMRKEA